MELKRDSRIEEDTDQVLNTQPLRVIDHVLSLLCCGKGHSSLTGIKLLGDHLQQWGYLPKEKWEKKYPITRDKIILLNWIKEHISPKTFTVKDALLECVGELKLLEDKDLSEIENFELNQAMNILYDIQQNTKRKEDGSSSHLMLEIKRMNSSPQVSPKSPRKTVNSNTETNFNQSPIGHSMPTSSPKSPLNNRKTGLEPRSQQPNLLSKPQRPGSQESTTDSEKSYLNLHREKRAQKQPSSEPGHSNQIAGNSNIPVPTQKSKKQTHDKKIEQIDSIRKILFHLMLRPSEDPRRFRNITEALSHEMKKKDIKSVLIQHLHENQPPFSLKHIGFKDGGEWSLFLRTDCPDALLAYATAQRYQLVLHVIHIGTRGAEEIKFYPHGQSQDNEDRHVFLAYLVDNTFLPLVPMEASDFPTHVRSSDEFQKCLTKIKNLEKENKSLKMKLHAVEESIKDEELPSDHKVALSEHVSLRLRRNSNNLEIDKLRQQLHLIKTKIEHHKRA